jgi:tetratricopeptide (TPR) repeat protein
MSEKLGDKLLQGRALNNLAFMYLKQGKFPLSLEYSFKALRNNEQTNDKYLISFSLRTLGDVYAKQGDSPRPSSTSGRRWRRPGKWATSI